MKKLLLLCLMLFSAILQVNAQLYYYLEDGKNLSEYQKIQICYFEDNYLQCNSRTKHEIIAKNANNPNFYEELSSSQIQRNKVWSYDASLSNGKYDVYVKFDDGVGYYRAFSKDKTQCISWRERPGSNNVIGKTYYTRISESSFHEDPHGFLD